MIKSIVTIIMMGLLMVPMVTIANSSLNDVVKEARQSGQVLSAKTRDGVHEVRVMTPQGTIRTVRKSAGQQVVRPENNQPQNHRNPNSRNPTGYQFDRRSEQPQHYQAEPKKETQNNRQETGQRSQPTQPRRSRTVQPSRQPHDRRPESKDPD